MTAVRRAARALAVAILLVAALPALAAKRPLPPGERVDVNRASVVELMRLPGIGRARAEAIAARRARAPFARVEELTAVRGLSRRWLEQNRAHLTASATSTGGTAGAVAGPVAAPSPKGRPPSSR